VENKVVLVIPALCRKVQGFFVSHTNVIPAQATAKAGQAGIQYQI